MSFVNTDVLAVIVMYKPEKAMLIQLVKPLLASGIPLVLINNGLDDPVWRGEIPSSVEYQRARANIGIPYHLQSLMQSTRDEGVRWLWYFDQDSRVSSEFIEAMIRAKAQAADGDGQLFAQYVEMVSGAFGYSIGRINRFPRTPIASGSLYRIEACIQAGGFPVSLPLDNFDFEISLRLQKAGYRVSYVPGICLEHSVGARARSGPGGLLRHEGHPPWRYAFKAAGTKYVLREHTFEYPRWALRHLIAWIYELGVSILLRRDRSQIAKAALLGALAGAPPSLPR